MMETAMLFQIFLSCIFVSCGVQGFCRLHGTFACGDGTCTLDHNHCDGHRDCWTAADEIFCDDDCPPDDICKYTLHGPCVSPDRRCSGKIDCVDASDELGCEIEKDDAYKVCRADEYLCPLSLTCMDYTRLCDGIRDCGEFDEEFCGRYCYPQNITLGTPEHGEPQQLLHYGLVNPDTGFYKCTWLVVAEVSSYIFINVTRLNIPCCGKLRLSAGLGESPTEVSETIFSIETSVLPSKRLYVTGLIRTAWIQIRSSRLLTRSGGEAISPRIELTVSLQLERICPQGFIECPNQSDVNLCIALSAVCDGHFDCSDYWDESQCSEHQAVQDLCGPQTITFTTTHQVNTTDVRAYSEPSHTLGVDCLWFVQPLPQSRIQVILDLFIGDGSTLTIGTATDFGMGLTADPTTIFVKVRAERLSLLVAHSPKGGVPIWIATRLVPGYGTPAILRFDLRYLNETECGPEEFPCGGKVCLPLSEQCNGIPQCPLLSDEKGCGTCDPSTFTCDGGTCLEDEFVCDGLSHCSDMMDEFLCGRCGNTNSTVRLTDYQAITMTLHMPDITGDCLFLITASSTSHRISIRLLNIPKGNIFLQLEFGEGHNPSNTSSLLHSVLFSRKVLPVTFPRVVTSRGSRMWIAYRFSDYIYKDDTSALAHDLFHMKVVQFNLSGCESDKHMCAPSTCIDQSAVCDGYVDCPDYSDETGCFGCRTDELRCVSEDKCIPRIRLCDMSLDCQAGSDESVCGHCGRNRIELSHHEGRDARPFLLVSPFSPLPVSMIFTLDCAWTIVAAPGHHVVAEINDFRLGTSWGNVRFGWGQDVGNLTTVIVPELGGTNLGLAAVASRDRYMWISLGLSLYAFPDYHWIAFRLKSRETVSCQEDQIACGMPDLICLQNSTTRYQLLYLCSNDICGERSVFLEEGTPYFLASPNYPNLYPANIDCNWEFHTLPVQDQRVFLVVTILDFKIETGLDALTIGGPGFVFGDKSTDAKNEMILSGTTSITSVTSVAADIYIKFTTSYWIEYTGFKLRIDAYTTSLPSECSEEQDLHCENTTFCIREDAVCNGFRDCAYGVDEKLCDICGERSVFLEEGTPYFLASPNYPNLYAPNIDCNWAFHTLPVLHQRVFFVITILDFATRSGFDTLTISGSGFVFGDKSTDELILSRTTGITTVTSMAADIYINFTADSVVQDRGFQLRIDAYTKSIPSECSEEQDLHCEKTTFCIREDAVCNGFWDCPYGSDEKTCHSGIKCPDFYQCSRSKECVFWDNVCDGTENCLLGDDERDCDVKRCPGECKCYYKDSDLYVICRSGWTKETLHNIAAITDVLDVSGGNFTWLGTGYFKRFINLKTLYLTSNQIERISPLAFEGLNNLQWLNISDNNFSKLEKQSFAELQTLEGIIISDVPLVWIEEAAFEGLRNLITMVLIRGKYKHLYDESIQIEQDALSDLTNLETLYLDDYTLCCEFGTLENFLPENCFTTELQSPLYNCGSLMQNNTLAVFM